jgi:integrase
MRKTNQTLSILFWLNRQRSKNQQPAIYLRFTLDYKRVELATHLYVDEQQWNPQAQCVKTSAIEAPEINRQLAIMKADLLKHYNRFQALDKPLSAEILKNVYLGIGERQTTLQEALEFYNSRFAEKVRTGHKAVNTLKCLCTTRDKVLAFVKHRFRVADIPLAEIKSSFAPDFEHFLTTVKRVGNNTAMKYIKILKRVMKMAVEQGWITTNPLTGFRCSYQEPQRERLTMEEVMTLHKKDLHIARLEEVRDVFLFCCFTGYAYHDVANLTPANLEIGIDGEKWITKDRQKTNSPERIPMLPIALEIVDRYKNHPYCMNSGRLLPVDSNQRYNGYLKEIAVLCGITKHLTTHTARHTFATTVTLENDVPIETVSQMLGHKSIRTTQIYAKITQHKISNNMRDLKKRLLA